MLMQGISKGGLGPWCRVGDLAIRLEIMCLPPEEQPGDGLTIQVIRHPSDGPWPPKTVRHVIAWARCFFEQFDPRAAQTSISTQLDLQTESLKMIMEDRGRYCNNYEEGGTWAPGSDVPRPDPKVTFPEGVQDGNMRIELHGPGYNERERWVGMGHWIVAVHLDGDANCEPDPVA